MSVAVVFGVCAGAWASGPTTRPAVDIAFVRFAWRVEQAALLGEPGPLADALNVPHIVKGALQGETVSLPVYQGICAGLRQAASRLCVEAHRAVQKGGHYRLVALLDRRDGVVARFRLWDEGLNYHEYHLRKSPAGKVLVDDMYVAAVGQNLSTLARSIMTGLMAEARDSRKGQGRQKRLEAIKNLTLIRTVRRHVEAGRTAEAHAAFGKLPAALRRSEPMYVIRLQIAARLGETEYAKALAEFRAAYPRSPAWILHSVDYYWLQKKWPQCHRALGAVASRYGDDAIVHLLRGLVYVQQGKPERARPEYDAALKAEPDLPDTYDAIVTLQFQQKDWAGLVRTFDLYEKNTGDAYLLLDESEMPAWKDLFASAEYRAWKASRAKRAKP